ncbi:WD40 repeat-like protein [Basidiobolus meristosporus CBS 931.73]|uniref:WD40 repeat-like protein n=1 Tax=Basidiobolus meristosporus CBS 931.73 TaxID=1314790 RepID=A0A1Y1YU46_9FUNG|nr:WD40 repeat-like protein [Basidiobolus meristosporus CBS 931.73]|eukprot:ORY01560.1 WD40 repeat-like protein [Basidiobolus meristosporus CBS 931.73]
MPRKEICTYNAPWPVYYLDWSKRPGHQKFRLAIGSFVEEYANKIQIIQLPETEEQFRHASGDFYCSAEVDHHYPPTKVTWAPYKGGHSSTDLLASSGDYLRLWELVDSGAPANGHIGGSPRMTSAGRTHQRLTKGELAAPLTSFDWCDADPKLAVTCSIDTTCTVWDIEKQQVKTQLIAHDREVYDVAFASGSADVFASVGADGSVRMFDLRSLEHSTIIYETPAVTGSNTSAAGGLTSGAPLLRLSFNKLDANYLATFHMDSTDVQILDLRVPGVPVTELRRHVANVNCVGWAPHNSSHLCTGGDDREVLVWDLRQLSASRPAKSLQDPLLSYTAEAEVNQLSWSPIMSEWIAVGFGKTVQALRI